MKNPMIAFLESNMKYIKLQDRKYLSRDLASKEKSLELGNQGLCSIPKIKLTFSTLIFQKQKVLGKEIFQGLYLHHSQIH